MTPVTTQISAPRVYVVESGDTCTRIAQRYRLPVNDLIVLNNLSIECPIKTGQRLLIPTDGETVPPTRIGSLAMQESPVDGMELIQIPAGIFFMGADNREPDASADEMPGHWVYLDTFWIDRTEVTNAMYETCVQAGGCSPPAEKGSKTRLFYYGDPRYRDYPVIHVSWEDASAYCQWMGRRLPTEAEWEKAARGADRRSYPWGDADPTTRLTNYNNQVGDTTPVGSYPDGASPYDLLDMAGNVREWVGDWYNAGYYRIAPVDNPHGPASGEFRVLRGGSWFSPGRAIRSAFRHWNIPDRGYDDSGFRCAR
jgi:formylglycine-generating enzyme required for sulfatase activity